MKYYKDSQRAFVNASGEFQRLFGSETKQANIFDRPETSLFNILKPSSIAEPSVAATSGVYFLSSTEQVNIGATNAISFIDNNLKDNENAKKLSSEFKAAQEAAIKSQEEELPKIVDSKQADNELTTYYRSIVDIQFSSRSLHTLAEEISKEDTIPENPETQGADIISRIYEKFKSIGERIKMKVQQVISRLRGIAESLGNSIINFLDNLGDTLRGGRQAIINAFMSVSDYFVDFLLTLTEQLFKFLTKFRSIASSEGYSVSNIQIKIPSLRFEYVNMFQVSIPLPNIDPPEMTLSIDQPAQKTHIENT